ncbi:MAG: hypothetical protein RL637_1185 [Pseudomonadota bacterium]|jgi:wyosine [tRNA(Phe)-imidazoG37] synthetase (radical SAM superfamily)
MSLTEHDRTSVGLKYVYPAMSRRSGGLSIGINLNPNNACNWRCIYCQIPNLIRGSAPPLDFSQLETELNHFLADIIEGDFYQRFKIESAKQQIKDIAISGSGEPTSLKEFPEAIELIGEIAQQWQLFPKSQFVLITNGSLIHQSRVQQGLKQFNDYHGQVWFKLDSATHNGRQLFNNTDQSPLAALENVKLCSQLCETKIQTCVFNYRDLAFSEIEKEAYLAFLTIVKQNTSIKQVLLYTIARASFQPEAAELTKLSPQALDQWAQTIQNLGFEVSVSY